MKTDGKFTIWQYEIPFDKYDVPIYLIPFGDVHKSSPMHCNDRWKNFLDWAKGKPRCYFLGMGDYDDLASTSERRLLNSPDIHESTAKTLEQLYMNNVKAFAKDISFMKGKLVGLIGGNHFGQFADGTSTDNRLANLMECKYLGCNSYIRLIFKPKTRPTVTMKLDIFAHHGRGGGRTVGASMNPVQQMANIAEADIYLMGDNHQKGVDFISRLRMNSTGKTMRLVQRKMLLARTGSFLKAYEDNQSSYITDMNLPPSDLGVVKIELTPRRIYEGKQEDNYVDIHASI